jgi:hypothetical protein
MVEKQAPKRRLVYLHVGVSFAKVLVDRYAETMKVVMGALKFDVAPHVPWPPCAISAAQRSTAV